jgi:hypothetical protein
MKPSEIGVKQCLGLDRRRGEIPGRTSQLKSLGVKLTRKQTELLAYAEKVMRYPQERRVHRLRAVWLPTRQLL